MLNAGTRHSFRNSAQVWRASIGPTGARLAAITALTMSPYDW